jgi:hypothetical protein
VFLLFATTSTPPPLLHTYLAAEDLSTRVKWPKLGSVLRTRYRCRKIKIHMYETIIQPAVLFGSETWTLTEKPTASLVFCGRKIIRRIYDPVCIIHGE